MIGRYKYFRSSSYQDVSLKGEFSLLTNPSSLINTLPATYFKNNDYYPDALTYNYTDIVFTLEPDKLSIDDTILNLLYLIPYTTYVARSNSVASAVGGNGDTSKVKVMDGEDILLDINNIPHIDGLFALEDDGLEYLVLPVSSDWGGMISYMEGKRRSAI
jgi:hypothetical protein